MEIIQRDNRYYLQLTNGELELTEQQAKKRIDRGDQVRDFFDAPEPELKSTGQAIPSFAAKTNVHATDTMEAPPPPTPTPKITSSQTYVSSGKYFDNLIREFEQIYAFSDDKAEALEKLTRFCKNAITKLHHDRRNPKSDHVVIDFYILSWSRVISFLKSLEHKEKEEAAATVVSTETEAVIQPPARNLTRQVLTIQLLQADGLFPISDALQGINQDDILNIICVMLHADKESVQEAMQTSSAILLKRGISGSNIEERIHLLQDMEKYFEQLPYSNIISRIKLLIKIYYEMAAEK